MDTEMRVTFKAFDKMVKLSDLKPSRYQRNTHPPEQIERLALIMREHGVTQPIHVHREYGEIAFGHGRKEAMILNGWDEAPIVYQDFKDDDEYYAKVQSDNGIASWSELDLSKINKDLADLGPMNIDLLGLKFFGVDPAELPEWAGMPEFNQEDKTAFKTCQLHFHSQEAVDQLAKLIGQPITENTRTIWYPSIIIEKASDKRYASDT